MKNLRTTAQQFLLKGKFSRISVLFLFTLLALSGIIILCDKYADNVGAQVSQKAITGEWLAEFRTSKPNEIYFMFQRRIEKGGVNMNSDNLQVSELQGLAADARTAAKTNVAFNIFREAGTFACEGYFNQGKGAGFWTFAPSEKFIAAMRSRGFDNLTEDNLLSAAMNNLTTKYADDLKTAGYDRLTFEELRRANNHDITLAYIREMKGAGFENLKMEELIRARNHDIDGKYVQEVKALGFENQPLEKLIRMRNHDINAEFITEMKSAGFENLSIEELIRLKNHDITAAFINELKAEGYTDVPAETAIRLKNHDVDRAFIQRARAQGYTNVTLEELIRLRNREIVK